MRQPGSSTRLPFPKFFAWFGYAVFSTLAIAGLLEAMAFGYFAVERRVRGTVQERCPCYAGQAWATELVAEEARRKKRGHGTYVPFRVWGAIPTSGNQVNVDVTPLGTLRRTEAPPKDRCSGKPVSRIWFFGGSTVFGTGVPDWATLPSKLSAALNAHGTTCFDVANFGVEGYVTNQEVLLFHEKLKEGLRPDHVVFYDGVNDAFVGGVGPGDAHVHMAFDRFKSRVEDRLDNNLRFLVESNVMQAVDRLLLRSDNASASPPSEQAFRERAVSTLDNYLANVRLVRLLANEYHFVPHFFWQPAIYVGQKPLTAYEKSVAGETDLHVAAQRRFKPGITAVYNEAERRSTTAEEFTYLGHVFDSVEEAVYIDPWMHLCPRGNEIVADVLARSIEAGIE